MSYENVLNRNFLHFRQHQKLRFELRDTRAKFALVLLEGEAVRAGKQGFDLVELVVLQNDVEIRRVRVPAFVKRGEIIAHAVPVLRLRGVLQFVELRAPVCDKTVGDGGIQERRAKMSASSRQNGIQKKFASFGTVLSDAQNFARAVEREQKNLRRAW